MAHWPLHTVQKIAAAKRKAKNGLQFFIPSRSGLDREGGYSSRHLLIFLFSSLKKLHQYIKKMVLRKQKKNLNTVENRKVVYSFCYWPNAMSLRRHRGKKNRVRFLLCSLKFTSRPGIRACVEDGTSVVAHSTVNYDSETEDLEPNQIIVAADRTLIVNFSVFLARLS